MFSPPTLGVAPIKAVTGANRLPRCVLPSTYQASPIATMRRTAKLSALRMLLSIPHGKPLRHESMLLGFIHRSHREISDVHAALAIGIFYCSAG